MARTEQIRVLIVDDEPVARRGLRNHLKKAADVEVIGEAGNGRDAVETIIQARPDLVFLDVQMPLLDGFRVIETLTEEHLPPAIVFVTAFDEHAIRAFEINALDYLLKPVDPKRLQKTLQRAREQIRSTRTGERDQKLFALLQDLQSRKTDYLERFVVKKAGRILFVDASENRVGVVRRQLRRTAQQRQDAPRARNDGPPGMQTQPARVHSYPSLDDCSHRHN